MCARISANSSAAAAMPADPGEHHGRDRLGRPQPQPRGSDHRERSLAPGQQLTKVIAGVVRGQARQPGQNASVGQYCLDAKQLGPGGPVPDRMDPAGVRGDHAADGGRVPGRQVDAVLQAGRRGVRAQFREGDPRAGGDLGGEGVHRVEPAQPAGGKEHRGRLAGRTGHRATDQPGVAALGDDGHAAVRAAPQHARHLRRRGGPGHAAGGPGVTAGPVPDVPGHQVRVGEYVLSADDRSEVGLQAGHGYQPRRIPAGRWNRPPTRCVKSP